MAIDFIGKNIIHKITAKFVPAFLPEAKKKYTLKAVHQPELNIHGVASKADVYNMTTSPKVIEEGFSAAMELMFYLAADGYKIKTLLFNLKIRLPGEYDGAETHLPAGIVPVARLQTSAAFRKYLKDRVQVEIDGIDQQDGLIAEALDEATGLVDEVATMGNILTIRGYGLKIEGDEERKNAMGVFFKPASGIPIKAAVLAVNEPRTLKVLVPTELNEGTAYTIAVETQSSPRHAGTMLKKVRDMRSEFTVTAQK
jgi:hypothetical protein